MNQETFEREVLQRLTAIETRLDMEHFDPAMCAVHAEQLNILKKEVSTIGLAQGKQNMIAASMGALGYAFVFLGKYLFTKGG